MMILFTYFMLVEFLSAATQKVAEFHKAALKNAANLQLFFILGNHGRRHAAIQSKANYTHVGIFTKDDANAGILVRTTLFLIKCFQIKFQLA